MIKIEVLNGDKPYGVLIFGFGYHTYRILLWDGHDLQYSLRDFPYNLKQYIKLGYTFRVVDDSSQ